MQLLQSSQAQSSSSSTLAWSLIWSLNIPPHVRHFIWRLCHDSLVCKQNLAKCGLPECGTCPRCVTKEESSQHIFFLCPFARNFLRSSGLPSEIIYLRASSWLDYLDSVKAQEDREFGIAETTFMIFWAI